MKIHHVGIAVKSIQKAKEKYEVLGFKVKKEVVTDQERNINILFMINGEEKIELIEIADNKKKSPITKFLSGACNNKMYHTCFETENLRNQIIHLQKQGFIIIEKPAEAPACENRRVCFLFSKETGIIELIETRGN